MEIETSTVQLLMEAGYLAGGYGFYKESEEIFEGIQAVRPDNELPLIGLAVTKMNAGNNEEAARILWEKALKINPESDLAKSFLGLALKLAGLKAESESVLKEVVDEGGNDPAVKLAQALLKEIGS